MKRLIKIFKRFLCRHKNVVEIISWKSDYKYKKKLPSKSKLEYVVYRKLRCEDCDKVLEKERKIKSKLDEISLKIYLREFGINIK